MFGKEALPLFYSTNAFVFSSEGPSLLQEAQQSAMVQHPIISDTRMTSFLSDLIWPLDRSRAVGIFPLRPTTTIFGEEDR